MLIYPKFIVISVQCERNNSLWEAITLKFFKESGEQLGLTLQSKQSVYFKSDLQSNVWSNFLNKFKYARTISSLMSLVLTSVPKEKYITPFSNLLMMASNSYVYLKLSLKLFVKKKRKRIWMKVRLPKKFVRILYIFCRSVLLKT